MGVVDPNNPPESLKAYFDRLKSDPAFAEAQELEDMSGRVEFEYLSDLAESLFTNGLIAPFLLLVQQRVNDLPDDERERLLRHLYD